MNVKITAKIKASLRALEKASDTEPLVFIDGKGNYWANDHARKFISLRKLPLKDFVEWLKVGSLHLQNIRFGDMGVYMLNLPGSGVLVFLKKEVERKKGKSGHAVLSAPLTAKEREVLRHVVKGLSNRQIAAAMKIAAGTVNSHLDSIYEKLGCTNRVAAGFLGLKNGLFLPSVDLPVARTIRAGKA